MNAMNVAFFLTHHKECNLFTLLDNVKNAMKVTFFLDIIMNVQSLASFTFFV